VELEAAKRGEASPDRRIDLVKAFAYPFPVAVISEMLGIPEEDRQTIENLSEVRIDNRDPAAVAKTRTQLLGFANYLKALFERKRREPGEDMISQMIQAQEDGDKLSESELLSMVFILYLGGHITTVNLIGNGVVALLSHPEQAAKLRNNLDLVKNVVEETLRYWGPVDFTGSPRMTKESVELGGTNIPKGASVTVGFGSANRDPKQFTNPDTFDITRADAHRHLAFGRGIHLCLGAPLARMEGQIAFETLFRRFPEMRLALPVESLRWNGAMGMRGYAEVPILF
jgi:cytochrome P450